MGARDHVFKTWPQRLRGAGLIEDTGSGLRFVLDGARGTSYANAQIDDYRDLPRRRFLWRPPLTLTVRARFSHTTAELHGTAGFGFWNDPFLMSGPRVPALPRAAWFLFASLPSDMKLAADVPGHGWKAATIDALRPAALVLAPLALPAMLLMNARSIYRALWPPIQRALNVGEALLDVEVRDWHTYRLEWGRELARFWLDTDLVLAAPAPRGPLGFVAWMDNQYLVATPWGRVRWGVLDVVGRQWLEMDTLSIEPQ